MIATATPRARNAAASTFCMKVMRSFIASCDPEGPDVRELVDEHVHDFGVPLRAAAFDQGCDRFVDRSGLAVRPVGDERVVRVANGHDAGEAGDGPPGEAVRISVAVEVLMVVA